MSSLSTGFTITSQPGCGSIIFEDTSNYGTGSSNNPTIDEVTSTEITFELSNGEIKTFTNFIPTDDSLLFQLFAGDLGYSEIIPDQIMNVTYTVYSGSGVVLGKASHPELLVCTFVNCFYGKVQQATLPGCCNGNVLLDQLSALWIRFIAIQATFQQSACCSQDDIEELNKMCSNLNEL